jgi:peptidoglycan hydrolase CwlO-like protein
MIKYGLLGLVGVGVLGAVLFGREAHSYFHSSFKSLQEAATESVPIEFQLRRARDMVEQIIPEMHANIRLIAQEEVEIGALQADIEESTAALTDEQKRVKKLRCALETETPQFTFAGVDYSRQQVKEDLARRFDRVKEAEVILAGKHRLLATRQQSVSAARQMLERTRSQKVQLEDQIEALESQHRLIAAASVGSKVQFDNSKIAQTEKLIGDIRKRLDVAERVLAHEARFVQPIMVDVIEEKDLLAQVDEYLSTDADQTEAPETVALSEATNAN